MTGDNDRPSTTRRPGGRQIADDLSSYVSLSGDFYRGEIHRTITWRRRLDQTAHWAIIVIAALLTWVFSSRDRPHYILIIGMFLLVVFLLIEAHRYRGYDVWRRRVRVLQEHLLAEMYVPTGEDTTWQEELGTELRNPSFTVPFRRAVAHRLRRVYLPLLSVLLVAWIVRITVFVVETPWHRAAAIPGLSGPVVVSGIGIVYFAIVGVALWSHRTTPREFRE